MAQNEMKSKPSAASTQEQEKRNESGEGKSQGGSGGILSFCFFIIFMFFLSVPVIYLLGTQKTHKDQFHPLSTIFKSEQYKAIMKDLKKKASPLINLHGKGNDGIYQFAQYYADEMAKNGKQVIIRRYDDSSLQTAFSLLRKTKIFFEDNLDFQEDQKNIIWIFIVEKAQFPEEQINAHKQKFPDQKIIVISQGKTKVSGFKNIKYPPITLESVKAVLIKQYEISEKEIQILFAFYEGIPDLFKAFQRVKAFTHKQFLEGHYFDVSKMKKDKQILKNLCEKGSADATKASVGLSDYQGVDIYKNIVYWNDEKSILNYELQKLVICKKELIPDSIKAEMQRQEKAKIEEKKKAKETANKAKKDSDKKKKSASGKKGQL